MELINRKHESINEKTRLRLEAYFKIADDRTVIFSAGCVIKYGLTPDLYVHFQNDEFRWYFYVNNDPDGFKLRPASGQGRKPVAIDNKSLIDLIKKRALISTGTRFPVSVTKSKLKNDHLFEIEFHKPLEQPTYYKK